MKMSANFSSELATRLLCQANEERVSIDKIIEFALVKYFHEASSKSPLVTLTH